MNDFLSLIADPPADVPTHSRVADRPAWVDEYNRGHTWDDLLNEAGWTLHHTDSDGKQYWTRPGKDPRLGHSATVGHRGNDLLHVFSDGANGLPIEKSMDRYGFMVHTKYGGDFKTAAKLATKQTGVGPADPYPEEEQSDDVRSVHLTPASSIRVRPVRWLWADRAAVGTLVLIGGREGVGKSMVTYQLAADITRGRLPGVFLGQPKSVIVAATEDSWEHTIVPRLMAADADLDRVFRVDVTTAEGFAGSLSLPRDLDALRHNIADVDAGVLLLDPLISRLEGRLDTHKDAEVRQALEPLVALADRCGVAIFGLIHVNKSVSMDPLTMLMASRAFSAVARAVLFVTVDPDDEKRRLLGQPKNNLGSTDLPSLSFTIASELVATTDEGEVWTGRVQWGDDDPRQIGEVLRHSAEPEELRTSTDEAADWLTDYLAIHTVIDSTGAKREAKRAGFSSSSVDRARKRIGAGVKSHGFPRRTWWAKPGMTPDEVDAFLGPVTSAAPVTSVTSAHGESDHDDVTGVTDVTSPRSAPVTSVTSPFSDPTRDDATVGSVR